LWRGHGAFLPFSRRFCAKLGKNNVNLQAENEINSFKINEYEK